MTANSTAVSQTSNAATADAEAEQNDDETNTAEDTVAEAQNPATEFGKLPGSVAASIEDTATGNPVDTVEENTVDSEITKQTDSVGDAVDDAENVTECPGSDSESW